jgi:hypothetical protein
VDGKGKTLIGKWKTHNTATETVSKTYENSQALADYA